MVLTTTELRTTMMNNANQCQKTPMPVNSREFIENKEQWGTQTNWRQAWGDKQVVGGQQGQQMGNDNIAPMSTITPLSLQM